MPRVSNEAIRRFTESIAQATVRVGGGQVGVSTDAIRSIVREQKDAAYRYVHLMLLESASQPGYLQPASMVAAAIQVEFGDEEPLLRIEERHRALGAPSTGVPRMFPDIETARRVARRKDDGADRDAVRMVETAPEDLERGQTGHLVRVFSAASRVPADAKRLRGTVALGFPSYDQDPRANYAIPAIRRFLRKLNQELPHFPYFLVPDRSTEQILVYLLCLVELQSPRSTRFSPPDLLAVAGQSADAVSRFCLSIGDDPERASEPLLLNLPAELLAELPDLAQKALRSMKTVLNAVTQEITDPSASFAEQPPHIKAIVCDASTLAGIKAAEFPSMRALLRAILARIG